MIREMYEGSGMHSIFVGLYNTMSSFLQVLKSLNTQYNPLIKSTKEPFDMAFDMKCEPSLSREIFMISGIVILTAVVVRYIWSSTRGYKIPEDCQIRKERENKKENGSRLKELYRTLEGLKNYLTASPEIETAYPVNNILLNERKKGMMPRSPYSEFCNQYGDNEEKYAKVKQNLLKALLLLEEQMESKEMDGGDARSRNLGYWSNKEEITEALRVLGIQESMQGNKRAEVSKDGERTWSKYPNLNTPQSNEKEMDIKLRKASVSDQCRQVANREGIVEALRVLGILESEPTVRKAEVINEVERPWSKYPNSNQFQSIFENEMVVKPRMPSSADQCTQVDHSSTVAKTEQALLPFQELERNGKSGAASTLSEYQGLNAGKSCCKQNEAQNSLKLSLMDIHSASLQQKATCDCSSMELSRKEGKGSTGLLNLTANRNTINIELLLNRNI